MSADNSPGAQLVHGIEVRGLAVDCQTRCAHYHQLIDVIAIRHYCCGTYYPCHLCHAALADHPALPVPAARHAEPAVLCGVCGHTLSVTEYAAAHRCPACQALFNPGCKTHLELYFELAAAR